MEDATEVKTEGSTVRALYNEDRNEVTLRIDRESGTGRPLYDTMVLDLAEAHALFDAMGAEILWTRWGTGIL